MKNNKIILIGKKGQLGQEFIAQRNNYSEYEFISFSREELNILDFQQVKDMVVLHKPKIIINTAAYHVMTDCEEHPNKAFETNVLAIFNLANICQKNRIRLVTYSTDYVFDGRKKKPYIESDTPNPLQIYGLSKYAGENTALNYNADSVVIRTCGVYGGRTGSRSKKGNFVLQILNDATKKNRIEVACEQTVSPTYAGDLAKASWEIIKKNAPSGIYHLVDEGQCSWAEFAQEIINFSKYKCQIVPIDRGGLSGTMKRPRYSVLENSKARKIGVILPHWKKGLEQYLKLVI